jgi:predicted nucleotidyltransferase
MSTLSDSFLQFLVTQLDNENTVGVTLTGSYARGEAAPFSDVDIHCYVRQMPSSAEETSYLRFMKGDLVSVSLTTQEDVYASLRNPKKAIWVVPALRQSRILLDKDGSIAALKEFAVMVTWEVLQTSADVYASWNLSGCTEEVYKILAGLARQDESKTLYAVWGLMHELANTLIIQHGILIQSENAYIDLVQETAGRTSDWTHQFRLAVGLDLLPPGEPAYRGYGVASLHLYRETARLLQDILLPEDASIVTQTLAIIAEAGY